MLMSLGMFGFELPTLAYDRLARSTDWRHAQTQRLGARPARQFLGPGDDTFRLAGCLAPEVAGDRFALQTLRDMGDEGEALPLVDGSGVVHGLFFIVRVDEEQQAFLQDGVARKTDFTIELARAEDDEALANG